MTTKPVPSAESIAKEAARWIRDNFDEDKTTLKDLQNVIQSAISRAVEEAQPNHLTAAVTQKLKDAEERERRMREALTKVAVKFREHFREGEITLHWRDALDALAEAELRVSEGSTGDGK